MKDVDKLLNKESLYIIAISFIFGLIAHGYCFANVNLSHDSLMISSYVSSSYTQFSLGRFGQFFYLYIRQYLNIPWLIGILEILYLSFTSIIVIEFLSIKDRKIKILTTAILITNFSISLTNATYIKDGDMYALSELFAVCGVYIMYEKKSIKRVILACTLFIMSLSLYQSNIQTAILLVAMKTILDCLKDNKFEDILKKLVIIIVVMCISALLYYGINKIFIWILGIPQSTDYNSVEKVASVSAQSLFTSILNVLRYELSFVLGGLSPYKYISAFINVIVIISILFFLIQKLRKLEDIKKILLVAILILAFPFIVSCVGVFAQFIHELMIYSYYFIYVFLLKIIDDEIEKKQLSRIIGKILIVLYSIMIYINCVFSNAHYYKKYLISQSTLSFCTRLIYDIEHTADYVIEETPVLFVGSVEKNPLLSKTRKEFEHFTGTGTEISLAITYSFTMKDYLDQYLSYPIIYYGDNGLAESVEYQNMPIYPQKGSIKMIDGVLVCKLS